MDNENYFSAGTPQIEYWILICSLCPGEKISLRPDPDTYSRLLLQWKNNSITSTRPKSLNLLSPLKNGLRKSKLFLYL